MSTNPGTQEGYGEAARGRAASHEPIAGEGASLSKRGGSRPVNGRR
jgi:hypothetical protein